MTSSHIIQEENRVINIDGDLTRLLSASPFPDPVVQESINEVRRASKLPDDNLEVVRVFCVNSLIRPKPTYPTTMLVFTQREFEHIALGVVEAVKIFGKEQAFKVLSSLFPPQDPPLTRGTALLLGSIVAWLITQDEQPAPDRLLQCACVLVEAAGNESKFALSQVGLEEE